MSFGPALEIDMRIDASGQGFFASDQPYSYEGRNLLIRPITFEDTSMVVQWRNEGAVKGNLFTRDDITSESHKRWLSTNVSTRKCDQFIVQVRSTGQPVGSVFLKDIASDKSEGEFGIFLGEDGRGRGFAKEATMLLLEHAFGTLGVQKVYLAVYSDNIAGIKAYKNAGFIEMPELGAEGTDGRPITYMGITEAQWGMMCPERRNVGLSAL